MKAFAFALLTMTLASGQASPAETASLPLGAGLPLVVRTGVHFLAVDKIDDSAATFDASLDLRLIWNDKRLSYPASDAASGFKEYRADAADELLATIWSPEIGLANMMGEPAFHSRGLRLYPDGRVEFLQRFKAQFHTPFDVERFPFDRQRLTVELVSHRDPRNQVVLNTQQEDMEFGRIAKDMAVSGWRIGALDMRQRALEGWHGESHARLYAALMVVRQSGTTISSIFIPLFASLLIPLLALWLNRTDAEGDFQIEAFELSNVLIGGLFALIALNFTVNSAYPMLAAGNPVSMLFGLNYALLAANLAINIALMRFGLVKRWFGPHVQKEVYAYSVWAVPALAIVSSLMIVLRAMA